MGVSDRVMGGDVTAKYNPAYAVGGDDDNDNDDDDDLLLESDSDTNMDEEEVQEDAVDAGGAAVEAQEFWRNLSDTAKHGRLFQALRVNAPRY
jgi:hypothetical protein